MPTCFLKRAVPFALALVAGVMLVKFLGVGDCQANRVALPQQSGFAEKRGLADERRAFSPRQVDEKARILSRPEPRYTEEARANAVQGTVVLRAVFSESGEVRNIRVMSALPDGLTERAIAAARQIRFTPAIRDGRAVSQYIQIEYHFFLD
jgi:TonB family protein